MRVVYLVCFKRETWTFDVDLKSYLLPKEFKVTSVGNRYGKALN